MTNLRMVSRRDNLAIEPTGQDAATLGNGQHQSYLRSGNAAIRLARRHGARISRRSSPATERLAALESFYARCEGKNLSPGTLRFYKDKLTAFTRWIDREGLDGLSLTELTAKHLRDFLTDERKRCSPMQARHCFVALRTFLKHLVTEGFLARSALDGVDPPKLPKKQLPAMTIDQVQALLATCDSEFFGIRDKAILLLLLDTGARAAELLAITIDQVSPPTGVITVMGKGSKERDVCYSDLAAAAVKDYLRRRVGLDTPSLFVNQYGEPLTYSGLAQLLRRRGQSAKLPAHITHPHAFRHTFATQFLRNGGDVFTLQKLLGHTTLTMTERYLTLTGEDMAATHRVCSPANAMRPMPPIPSGRHRIR